MMFADEHSAFWRRLRQLQLGRHARQNVFYRLAGLSSKSFDMERMQADVLPLEDDHADRIKMDPGFQSIDERFEHIRQIQVRTCRLGDVQNELSAGLENITG